MTYARSAVRTVRTRSSPEDVFGRLDDPTALGSHMQKPSAMMFGGTMRYELDEGRGRTVGSVIRMTGNVLGLRLFLEGVVTRGRRPFRRPGKRGRHTAPRDRPLPYGLHGHASRRRQPCRHLYR